MQSQTVQCVNKRHIHTQTLMQGAINCENQCSSCVHRLVSCAHSMRVILVSSRRACAYPPQHTPKISPSSQIYCITKGGRTSAQTLLWTACRLQIAAWRLLTLPASAAAAAAVSAAASRNTPPPAQPFTPCSWLVAELSCDWLQNNLLKTCGYKCSQDDRQGRHSQSLREAPCTQGVIHRRASITMLGAAQITTPTSGCQISTHYTSCRQHADTPTNSPPAGSSSS